MRYDGWNLVAEVNATNHNAARGYCWGLDLSGSLQGAGGIGGLAAITYYGSSSTNCVVAYDGNGNVAGLINVTDGASTAQYEYGPFGEVIRATGPMAKANPFRFSTKFQDDETDLLYYGYRYYSANMGRWLNWDPLMEAGGLNLFGFVGNEVTGVCDKLGLAGYEYVVITPTGDFEVWLQDLDYKDETVHGFRSKYIPSQNPPCPCKRQDIILVQAVYDPALRKIMDNGVAYRKHRKASGDVPIPGYWEYTPADAQGFAADPLVIVDAPILEKSEMNNGTWEVEDCAVCRRKLRDGTIFDRVLGCVKFSFKRVHTGKVELEVQSAGETLKGLQMYHVPAEMPGKLWERALHDWRTTTGDGGKL